MSDILRNTLKDIVKQYGVDVFNEPMRLRGLLDDYCKDQFKPEKKIVVCAVEENIHSALLSNTALPITLLKSQLAKRLHDEHGFILDLAIRVVDCFAFALEISSPTDESKIKVIKQEATISISSQPKAVSQNPSIITNTMARLAIISQPEGASVWIDGKDTSVVTPYEYVENLKLQRNRKIKLDLKMTGHDDYNVMTDLIRGETICVDAALIDRQSYLKIDTTPPGAVVYINDKNSDLITPCEYVMDLKGKQSQEIYLELRRTGCDDFCGVVELKRGETIVITALLEDRQGYLKINTTPSSAAVFIDKKDIGLKTPCEYVMDLKGQQSQEIYLELRRIGYEDFCGVVELKRGEISDANITLVKRYINPKYGIDLIHIPAGDFLYGEKKDCENLPDFEIMKNPVTVAQYRQFCDATKRTMPSLPKWGWHDTHPMVNVTWYDAVAFAEWAGLSLPTEIEWEKAARGTDGRAYPWGNNWDAIKCCNSVSVRKAAGQTSPIGSYPDGNSPYGVQDMSGNVWEWCDSWYKDNSTRVVRGGSWVTSIPDFFCAAFRLNYNPTYGDIHYGFRCILRSPEL